MAYQPKFRSEGCQYRSLLGDGADAVSDGPGGADGLLVWWQFGALDGIGVANEPDYYAAGILFYV